MYIHTHVYILHINKKETFFIAATYVNCATVLLLGGSTGVV